MSTLLDNSSRPIWVWIVVIVIGSLVILGLVSWLIRYLVLRRRDNSDLDYLSDEPAEKKLTLRRGRIVPAASYLSLTGSRFGLSSYNREDGVQSPSVRSKSPFEWWASIRGRSSRLSYVSHSSSYPTSPRVGSFYQRAEHSTSKLSFRSKEDTQTTVTEVMLSRPQSTLVVPSFQRSSRSLEPVNFSRSFSHQTQRSLAAFRNQTLSRIEETTPRQSMFSTASFRLPFGSHGTGHNSPVITVTEPQPSRRVSSATLLNTPPPINTHSRSSSARSALEMTQRGGDHEIGIARISRSPSLPTTPTYMSSMPTTPTFPEPISESYSGPLGRSSVWDSSMKQFPWLDEHHHQNDHQDYQYEQQHSDYEDNYSQLHTEPQFGGTQIPHRYTSSLPTLTLPPNFADDHSQPQPQPATLTTRSQPQQTPETGLGIFSAPRRVRSKKGNVLRKKSLHRVEMF